MPTTYGEFLNYFYSDVYPNQNEKRKAFFDKYFHKRRVNIDPLVASCLFMLTCRGKTPHSEEIQKFLISRMDYKATMFVKRNKWFNLVGGVKSKELIETQLRKKEIVEIFSY